MLEKTYLALEAFFGLDINTILSGIGITFGAIVFFILKFMFNKFFNREESYNPPSIIEVKKDVENSSIENLDIEGGSTQVISVGGSIKNSSIKGIRNRNYDG